METITDLIISAAEGVSLAVGQADVYLLALSGLIVALAGIAKLTKTKKDDKYIAIAKEYLDKVISVVSNLKPKKTK